MEKVTLLVCVQICLAPKNNLFLLIGKFKNPKCFRDSVTCLPVLYEANKNAWMTFSLVKGNGMGY